MNTKIIRAHFLTVALVGRVNVGKSTLFNRLIEKSHAIVSDIPGTTRTRNIEVCIWRGQKIRLIDTGGLTGDTNAPFEKDILKQAEIAIQEADIILVIVDGQVNPLTADKLIAKKCRDAGKPIRLVVNKIDNERLQMLAQEKNWKQLGLGEPIFVSGATGRNTGELLDEITKINISSDISAEPPIEQKSEKILIALMGKPNVGKSSLFNALIGQEYAVVSSIPHTTREPFDTEVLWNDTNMVFVDTAGIRRKALIKKGMEKEGVVKSIESLKKADIGLLILDAKEPVSAQDKHLGGLIEQTGRGLIIIINKWDLTKNADENAQKEIIERIKNIFPFLAYAPVLFVSAKTKEKINKIFPLIKEVYRNMYISLNQETLEDFLKKITRRHKPSRDKGTRHPKIIGFSQIDTNPPVFQITIKYKTSLHKSYLHYIENKLREYFGFTGTPIKIIMRKGEI